MPEADFMPAVRDALIDSTARAAAKIATEESQRSLTFESDTMHPREAFELGYRIACARIAESILKELL